MSLKWHITERLVEQYNIIKPPRLNVEYLYWFTSIRSSFSSCVWELQNKSTSTLNDFSLYGSSKPFKHFSFNDAWSLGTVGSSAHKCIARLIVTERADNFCTASSDGNSTRYHG